MIRTNTNAALLTVLLMTIGAGVSVAQSVPPPSRSLSQGTTAFGVRTMDFDLWCQQTQRYSPERCAARRPEDLRAFDSYRASVERYELDYLKQMQRDEQVRARTNRDPSQTVRGKQDGFP